MTKKESAKILEIAKKYIYAIEVRGSLEMMQSDSDDFIETSVGSIEAALEAAYSSGKAAR